MLHKFLLNAKFHLFVIFIDNYLADQTQQKGCPYCGKKLYNSDYPRSPFGIPSIFRDYYQSRRSFCCEQCRKRTTPPSVRFFGRRWYVAPFFLLISAMIEGSTQRHIANVLRHLGLTINQRTWKRWYHWWEEYFPTLPFWKKMKGTLPIHSICGPFPKMLLAIFFGQLEDKLKMVLIFLAPITAGALRAV